MNRVGLEKRKERRQKLWDLIKKNHPDAQGTLFLVGDYEHDRQLFFQDSSFFYFVGLQEPGLIFTENGVETVLYEPAYSIDRSIWLSCSDIKALAHKAGIVQVKAAGEPINGYSLTTAFVEKNNFKEVVAVLSKLVLQERALFVPLACMSEGARAFFQILCSFVPESSKYLIDVSPEVGQVRRVKEKYEIEQMYHAIEATALAQSTALSVIAPGINEAEVQGMIDFVYAQQHAQHAFLSIVGSGENSTVLHYVDNNKVMQSGEVVVVDCGASYGHYAADVTRTYPVGDTFTKRQQEVYQLVLDVQDYIAQQARPGIYLNNPDKPQESLNHLARAFLKDKGGYDIHFPHGIGHFVGLDVHDVGNSKEPLQPGDVITIEPGIYIKDEDLGIRIEDMYWIMEDGAFCLTEGIPKDLKEIEQEKRAYKQPERAKNREKKEAKA